MIFEVRVHYSVLLHLPSVLCYSGCTKYSVLFFLPSPCTFPLIYFLIPLLMTMPYPTFFTNLDKLNSMTHSHYSFNVVLFDFCHDVL